MRAVKTSIAVAICAFISMFFDHEDIFTACIAAAMCMERTYEQTVSTGVNRCIGTMIGGLVGYIALESTCSLPCYDWLRIIVLPICILVVVYTCNIINKKSAVSIGCVVVIVILSRTGDRTGSALTYVIQRVCDTLLGVLVATVVNKFTFNKKGKLMRYNKE